MPARLPGDPAFAQHHRHHTPGIERDQAFQRRAIPGNNQHPGGAESQRKQRRTHPRVPVAPRISRLWPGRRADLRIAE
jgi:hypothetical protein